MSTPYFSIIILTLNEEKFIPKLLLNLNQQSYKDFEVIVVDGQSEDETQSIVKQFPTTFLLTCIVSNKRNVSHQRNLGASGAKGKVLIFFDADTQIPKNYLEKIHHCFETKRPHFLTTYMRADSKDPGASLFASFSNQLFEIGRIIKFPSVYGAMMAIKRTVFEDIGEFDCKILFGEDTELFMRALNYNYKYTILMHPKYTFSLRRYRSEGTLDTLIQYIRLYISMSVNGFHSSFQKYPMGGHVYKSKAKAPELVKRFERLLIKLNKAPSDQSDKARVFFKRLFSA